MKTIWRNFINGNSSAFSALFEQASGFLYKYGLKFVIDEEIVKDCIQDLFVKLYKNRQSLPELENPTFYLLKAYRNLLISCIQERRRIIYLSPQELLFHAEFMFDNQEEPFDNEIKERFEEVINMLSDRQKEAIYLRYQVDMSYEEISKVLDINYQSARNLVHRSIEKIRSAIKNEEREYK